ncbi:MAG: MFS transporter [Actinomycetota bacterium]|nr:MFS transporter [Actinomycetota bacterium]
MTSAPAVPTAASGAVTRAVRATYASFILSGFAMSSWAARIPQVRDELGLTPSALGLVLLSIAAGSIVALTVAGLLVGRLGSQRVVAAMALVLGVGLVGVALGYRSGVAPLVVALVVFGFANGAWDVAMNVQGALAERALGRSIMSRFHAGWSVGTVAGALLSAGLVALHVPVSLHLAAVGVLVAALVPFRVRGFLPDDHGVPEATDAYPERSVWAAWREPRTLLIGVFVLTFAFAEGTGNDWIAVAAIDGYGVSPAIGTLGFALFLAAMTTGRWVGPDLLDRHGRVVMVRLTAGLAVVGLLLFVFAGHPALAFVGALLWGLGTSLGFPVGMSAGADEPRYAAGRVSVIASIGYVAFLGGPPLIGFLGDHEGVLKGLSVVAVLMALAILVSGALRPPEPRR